MAAFALGGCPSESPADASEDSGSAGTDGTTSDPATGSTAGEEQTSSSSGVAQTDSSSGGEADGCTLLEEAIEMPRLDLLANEGSFADVPCDVTDDGFLCTFEKEPELVEVDAAVEGFAPLPWQSGQSVLISGFGPDLSAYEARLTVRTPEGEVLAVMVWNLGFLPEPFELLLEDIGCVDPDSGAIPLEATYRFEGDEVTLLGTGSGVLGNYTVFQDDARDYSDVSAGELGQAATFAILLNP